MFFARVFSFTCKNTRERPRYQSWIEAGLCLEVGSAVIFAFLLDMLTMYWSSLSLSFQSREACQSGLFLAPDDETLLEGLEEAKGMLSKGVTEIDRGDTAFKVCTTDMV